MSWVQRQNAGEHGLVIMSSLVLKRQFLNGKECKFSLYAIDCKDYYYLRERDKSVQDRAKDVLVHPSSLLKRARLG